MFRWVGVGLVHSSVMAVWLWLVRWLGGWVSESGLVVE